MSSAENLQLLTTLWTTTKPRCCISILSSNETNDRLSNHDLHCVWKTKLIKQQFISQFAAAKLLLFDNNIEYRNLKHLRCREFSCWSFRFSRWAWRDRPRLLSWSRRLPRHRAAPTSWRARDCRFPWFAPSESIYCGCALALHTIMTKRSSSACKIALNDAKGARKVEALVGNNFATSQRAHGSGKCSSVFCHRWNFVQTAINQKFVRFIRYIE